MDDLIGGVLLISIVVAIAAIGALCHRSTTDQLEDFGGPDEHCYPNRTCDDGRTCWELGEGKFICKDPAWIPVAQGREP